MNLKVELFPISELVRF